MGGGGLGGGGVRQGGAAGGGCLNRLFLDPPFCERESEAHGESTLYPKCRFIYEGDVWRHSHVASLKIKVFYKIKMFYIIQYIQFV